MRLHSWTWRLLDADLHHLAVHLHTNVHLAQEHHTILMEYQINYTNGRDICATEYINARSHMEAWSKGSARAQGRERVHSVYPMNMQTYKEF